MVLCRELGLLWLMVGLGLLHCTCATTHKCSLCFQDLVDKRLHILDAGELVHGRRVAAREDLQHPAVWIACVEAGVKLGRGDVAELVKRDTAHEGMPVALDVDAFVCQNDSRSASPALCAASLSACHAANAGQRPPKRRKRAQDNHRRGAHVCFPSPGWVRASHRHHTLPRPHAGIRRSIR